LWQRAAGRETECAMPPLQLPIFPADGTPINPQIAVSCASGKVVYVHGLLPVLQHQKQTYHSEAFFFSGEGFSDGTLRLTRMAAVTETPVLLGLEFVCFAIHSQEKCFILA
jgi:hypothetical protein